jgi:hypothetical protein
MIKNLFFLLALFLYTSLPSTVVGQSAFRSAYTRLGINKLGSDLDHNLSPFQNVFDGRYGAGTGYVFEFGRIFYFKNKDKPGMINYGLDWTYLSLNYNKMDGWEAYGAASGAQSYYIEGTGIAAAISSKIGPVLSINPIEKLVVDVRFQIAPVARFFDLSYEEEEAGGDGRYFYFTNESGDDDDSESIQNRIAFGVATSYGITVRRKSFGLSVDYVSGKVKSNYDSYDGSTFLFGKEKIPARNLHFKLSLTL